MADEFDLTSPEREARAEQERLQNQTEIADLQWLMSDARGRRFMWRLLNSAHVFRSSFTGDALTSAFHEGERNIGLVQINAITEHCLARYIEMQKEAQKK